MIEWIRNDSVNHITNLVVCDMVSEKVGSEKVVKLKTYKASHMFIRNHNIVKSMTKYNKDIHGDYQ